MPRRQRQAGRPGLLRRAQLSTAIVVLAGCGIASPALASRARLHRIARTVEGFSSDGTRYAAWQTSALGPIVALDTVTGRRWTANEGGCTLEDLGAAGDGVPAEGGRFLVLCGGASELLDARTSTLRPLPSGTDTPVWTTVGSRYIEGRAASATCRQTSRELREQRPCAALYELATGAVTYRHQSRAADLDRPEAPPVCKAIRSRLDDYRPGYSHGVLVEPGKTVRIYRCHGASQTLRGPSNLADLQLSGGIVSWDTGVHAEELPDPGQGLNGTLTAYSLRSGRRQQLPLPKTRVAMLPEHPRAGVFGYSAHTADMVFWIATRTVVPGHAGVTIGPSDVYAAKL